MNDMHSYPGPAMPEPEARRAVVLGEFGGLGLPVEGHLWWDKRNWGYRTYKTKDELRMNYKLLMRQLHPLIERGLAAAIYTQTTDVEGEVNGLLTYDRSEIKPGLDWLAAINNKLYGPPPVLTVTNVLPTSEKEAVQWKYTTDKPADDGWQQADFDDAQWNAGPGGFGDPTTPGSVVRTNWKTDDIWLRQEFSLDKLATDGLHLRLHHDEDVEVFVNGKRVASLTGFQTGYVNVDVGEQLAKQLRRGKNVIAVHCHQTGGGQYIDVGIVQEIEKPAN